MEGFDIQRFKSIKQRYSDLMSEKKVKERDLESERKRHEGLKIRYQDALDGRTIIQRSAKKTQDRLGDRMGSLVSMALDAVFPDDPYIFKLEFVERRGKTECDVIFQKAGKDLDPMLTSGGGPKDVASFFARIAAWSLKKNYRPIIFSDEGFKFLHSPSYQSNCSDVLQAVSSNLTVQMIIVTDQAHLHGDNIIDL